MKNAFRKRFDFSKIKTTVPIPNLIEIQKKSYERFLQMNRLPSEREDAGLQSVFKSVFPISDFRENSSLEFIEYSIGNWECKCGKLQGLHHLRKPCSDCGATLIADPYGDREVLCPRCGKANQARGDVCDICGNTGRLEAEVRRRRVPGARHDLRRAAEGHDPPRRLEQGPRDRRQDHPRHQGAGGLLRRHPADDRERHVHHQRHRARHRQPAAPLAGRVLPPGRQDALRRADHSVPRLVGGVRVRPRRTCSTSASTASASSWARCSCAPSACAPPKTFSGPSTRSIVCAVNDKKLYWTLDPASEKPTNLLGMKLAHSIKYKSGEEIAHSGRKINAADPEGHPEGEDHRNRSRRHRARRRLGRRRRGRHHHRRSACSKPTPS